MEGLELFQPALQPGGVDTHVTTTKAQAGVDVKAIGAGLGGGVIGEPPDQAAGFPGDAAFFHIACKTPRARAGQSDGVQPRQQISRRALGGGKAQRSPAFHGHDIIPGAAVIPAVNRRAGVQGRRIDRRQTDPGHQRQSRDDAEGKFIPVYLEKKIIKDNPFAVLDRKGVGGLMKMAIEKARTTRPGILMGICGEHGGEPKSVEFCHKIGLNYVSCSPFRVPIARLAAAQAAVKDMKKAKPAKASSQKTVAKKAVAKKKVVVKKKVSKKK